MTIDLNIASKENLKHILDQLATKLGVANRILFDEKFYRLEQYHDLKFLHDHLQETERLSPAEIQAFVDELRSIRDK